MNKNQHIVSVYDNGGTMFHRYCIFTDKCYHEYHEALIVSSKEPAESVFTYGIIGAVWGEPIKFSDLPENVQKHVNKRISSGQRKAITKD